MQNFCPLASTPREEFEVRDMQTGGCHFFPFWIRIVLTFLTHSDASLARGDDEERLSYLIFCKLGS